MEAFIDGLSALVNPQSIIHYGGLYLLLFVIFAETGLFFGFFLPGDSLLFIAGLFCASSEVLILNGEEPLLDASISNLIIYLAIAGVLGNFIGYWFGKKAGESLLTREDTWIFKKKYIYLAKDFYAKHGALALILGRFLPIIRTFAPIFAGVVNMNFLRFALFNVLGSILWILSFTLLGYFLGKSFPSILDYLHYIVISFVLITTVPIIVGLVKKKELSA